jgi:hypothetical protein
MSVIETNKKSYATPINLSGNVSGHMKKAKMDYLREISSRKNIQWDNTSKNSIAVGDQFSFVNNTLNTMRTHQVINILTAQHRINEWDIAQHQNRNVIVLSTEYAESNFYEYKQAVGYNPNYIVRGTTANRAIQ